MGWIIRDWLRWRLGYMGVGLKDPIDWGNIVTSMGAGLDGFGPGIGLGLG